MQMKLRDMPPEDRAGITWNSVLSEDTATACDMTCNAQHRAGYYYSPNFGPLVCYTECVLTPFSHMYSVIIPDLTHHAPANPTCTPRFTIQATPIRTPISREVEMPPALLTAPAAVFVDVVEEGAEEVVDDGPDEEGGMVVVVVRVEDDGGGDALVEIVEMAG